MLFVSVVFLCVALYEGPRSEGVFARAFHECKQTITVPGPLIVDLTPNDAPFGHTITHAMMNRMHLENEFNIQLAQLTRLYCYP
jgi:hypothetical protein